MQLLRQVDPTRPANIRINPAQCSTFFVRSFDDTDGRDRAGHVVTAAIMSAGRESKFRLTPLLRRPEADRALELLEVLLISGVPGIIGWDGDSWEVVEFDKAVERLRGEKVIEQTVAAAASRA